MLWGISFQNLSMLMATIPSYDADETEKEKLVGGIDDIQDLDKFI